MGCVGLHHSLYCYARITPRSEAGECLGMGINSCSRLLYLDVILLIEVKHYYSFQDLQWQHAGPVVKSWPYVHLGEMHFLLAHMDG